MRNKVLIVDDDEIICELGVEMFDIFDAPTTAVQTMAEATQYFSEQYAEIGLVIIDLNLQECTGVDVFNTIKEIDPSLNAVIASGQFIESDAKQYLDMGFKELILKPYTLDKIKEMIGKYLE